MATGAVHAARAAGFFAVAMVCVLGCAGGPEVRPAERRRYGEVMSEVGRRFELMGRAAEARRWKLASFELAELQEALVEVTQAPRPQGTGEPALREHLGHLKRALTAEDFAGFEAAFAGAAASCDACHEASGQGFIAVRGRPGAAVPRLDPIPAP